jgi:hypothetical protein
MCSVVNVFSFFHSKVSLVKRRRVVNICKRQMIKLMQKILCSHKLTTLLTNYFDNETLGNGCSATDALLPRGTAANSNRPKLWITFLCNVIIRQPTLAYVGYR